MNEELLAEAKKYKVHLTKYAFREFPTRDEQKAKDWLDIINTFFAEYNLVDAKISFSYDGYEGSLDSIIISAQVDKTEEEILAEVAAAKELETQKRKDARDRKKERETEERNTYERLRKKYGKNL